MQEVLVWKTQKEVESTDIKVESYVKIIYAEELVPLLIDDIEQV